MACDWSQPVDVPNNVIAHFDTTARGDARRRQSMYVSIADAIELPNTLVIYADLEVLCGVDTSAIAWGDAIPITNMAHSELCLGQATTPSIYGMIDSAAICAGMYGDEDVLGTLINNDTAIALFLENASCAYGTHIWEQLQILLQCYDIAVTIALQDDRSHFKQLIVPNGQINLRVPLSYQPIRGSFVC